MLQNMGNTLLEIGNAFRVRVPGRHIVVAGFPVRAVEGWQVVFGNISIVSPTAKLVPVMQRDREFDVYNDAESAIKSV